MPWVKWVTAVVKAVVPEATVWARLFNTLQAYSKIPVVASVAPVQDQVWVVVLVGEETFTVGVPGTEGAVVSRVRETLASSPLSVVLPLESVARR